MYQMHRVFCATPWELEGERLAFQDVLGAFNESTAMPRGILLVPVSLAGMRDKRPYQYTVDENIRACRYYILAIGDNWGPPERNFERDYQLAEACRLDPAMPMVDVAFLFKTPQPGQPAPPRLPPARSEFVTTDEFSQHLQRLLTAWIETPA